MDHEKKYKELVGKIKKAYLYTQTDSTKAVLEDILPELKESEDVLTWLTKYIEEEAYSLSIDIRDNEDRIKLKNLQKAFAWLEKQGNQREQLINKACDILVNCIEDYMLRRMEVWSEECKNQTLENIRKKLEE